MRTNQWLISIVLFSSLAAFSVYAADQAPAANTADTKLEKIGDTPSTTKDKTSDGPMHHGEKKCDHKQGDSCPHHKDKNHHGKMHEKCDHDHH